MKSNRRTLRRSLLLALVWTLSLPLPAQTFLDEETRQLMVGAVTAATALDLYNARCRSDVSGRRTDNLNKVLVSKFRMTVIEVEDDLFPDGSYRQVRERLQREFLGRLKGAGGCRDAKKTGIPERLRERYNDLMREIDRLP